MVLSRIPGKGHSKLITAGLGWASAEVILSRGLLLWFGARGAEFSWLYIQKCLESNISLVSVSHASSFDTPGHWNIFLFNLFVCSPRSTDPAFDYCNIVVAVHTSRLEFQI